MTIGNRILNQVDPERQMETVIGYIKGDNTQESVVQKARFAINKARNSTQDDNINIIRTYTMDELSEMESILDRMEILVIRKRAGEIISPEEIDRVSIRNKKSSKPPVPPIPSKVEVAETKPSEAFGTEEESTIETTKADKIITEIEREIDIAKILLSSDPKLIMDRIKGAKEHLEKAVRLIDHAESDEIDVEEQKKKLSDFTQKHSKIL